MSGALLLLLSAVAVASPVAMAGPAAERVVREVLPSGVHVVVMRVRSARMVAARAVWRGGPDREPAELAGLSRLLAAAWTGGCGRLDQETLGRELAADSASMAGFAGRETIGLRAEWTRVGWERGFELLADCVVSPGFSAEAIAQARRRAAENAAEREGSPAWVALDLLDDALHAPGRSTAAALAPVLAVERADSRQIRAHYSAHYAISTMTLAVVGNVDPSTVLARARARFGSAPRVHRPEQPAPGLASASVSAPASEKAGQAAPELELYRHLTGARDDVAAIAVGFAAVGRAHRDRAALEVAAQLMGGAANATLVTDADAGYLALHRTCRTEDIPAALAALRRATDRLRDPGASEEEVRRAAGRLVQARREALGRPEQAAALLALYEALGPGAEHAARHAERLGAVRAADVRAAVGRYLRPDAEVIATAMPLLASPEAARRMSETTRRPQRGRRGRR